MCLITGATTLHLSLIVNGLQLNLQEYGMIWHTIVSAWKICVN